ncbi:hypothetical protein [Arhodomonas sp. AD133]|uniref:hypothetical protein n=1 Tax=Arhodomonas sp. AD133 TaxID=3415009 RepID=UPI003EB9D880
MATCYKVMDGDCARELVGSLREDGFGFDPEITCLLASMGARFTEVEASYRPRTAAEGKKIKWQDGMTAVRVLLGNSVDRGPALVSSGEA